MIDEKPISPRAYSLISTFTLVANNLFADYFFASNSVTKSRSFASIEGDFFVASAKKRRYLLLAFAYKLCNNRDCVVGRKISKQTSMQSSTPTMHHTKDMYDRHTRLSPLREAGQLGEAIQWLCNSADSWIRPKHTLDLVFFLRSLSAHIFHCILASMPNTS